MQAPARVQSLHWRQGLQFKLALLLAVILLLLGVGTWFAGDRLVRVELARDSFRYERESAQRVGDRMIALSDQVESLANALAVLALQPPAAGGARNNAFVAALPGLVERNGANGLIVAAGVWPAPRTPETNADRGSSFLLRESGGGFVPRNDYNDPRAVSYAQEPWYTPARYQQPGRCYWTPAYREPLSRQDVVSCTMPLTDARGFVGAVTISLSLIRLNELFARITTENTGYSLLIGRDGRLLGVSDLAARGFGPKPPANLVELAQQRPRFNPLALTLHQQSEAFISAAVQNPSYDAATVSALKDASRNLSRQEAESALAAIWNQSGRRQTEAPRMVRVATDPVMDGAAFATVVEVPRSFWRVVRVTAEAEGLNGVQYFFDRTLMVIGAAVLVAVLLIYLAVNFLVLRPLRRMAGALANAGTGDDALQLQLEERANNEIGMLSVWHNERVRQLRDFVDRTQATHSQLAMESDERRSAQEALTKTQERASLALQAVADGVILTNERGLIEEMNPVAEQLVGITARAARGRSFADVFKAQLRSADDGLLDLPDLAGDAMQRDNRVEFSGGLVLQTDLREIELQVSVTPVRTRLNRVVGAIVVFRPATLALALIDGPAGGDDPRNVDGITGLPNRIACDRALRAVLENRDNLETHPCVLLAIDVDHLKRINDQFGQLCGDEALARLGESLVSRVSGSGEVFRMGADQFVVVLPGFDTERGRTFAEGLREFIGNARIYWESRPINVTVSIGLIAVTPQIESPVELLRRAEDACAGAKRAGRNAVMVYSDDLDRAERTTDDAIWVRRIRAGIEDNLFHLTTQWVMPTPALQSDGQVFDVLLALEDEEGFWASPGAFLPVAERHGLLPQMDRWVISNVLECMERSPEALERLAFCSINLSAPTLADHSLPEYLAELIQRYGDGAARKLCFELREEALMEFPSQSLVFCEAMRSLGVRVAVDHFAGRSTSDIGLLRRLSLDFVKIDALLYRSLATDTVEQLLAESVLKLARALRKRVIVANIGDAATLEAWKKLGADYFLGFAIAKPSPVVFYAPNG